MCVGVCLYDPASLLASLKLWKRKRTGMVGRRGVGRDDEQHASLMPAHR